MISRKKIHFIINPISGKGKNILDVELLSAVFSDQKFEIILKTSKQKKEAKKLAISSVKEGADVVVACGGDGTINEVASALVDTSVHLGILRYGSGNGLASNLYIPKKIQDALLVIKEGVVTKIDVGVLNNQFFFSNTSLSFGAQLIFYYSRAQHRQLQSYVTSFLKALIKTHRPPPFSVNIDGQTKKIRPFIFFISNSNEMGYNFTLTPQASLKDGKLDLLYIENVSIWDKAILAVLMFFKKIKKSKHAQYHIVEKIEIVNEQSLTTLIQIDGESDLLQTNKISVYIKKSALNVIIP